MEDKKLKFVSLKGELKDMGNHILMPFGVTLCGLPTTDASLKDFPQLDSPHFKDMIYEYQDEDDVTCEKCLEVFSIIEKADKNKKVQNN